MFEKKRLCILIPIYNDWQSLNLLLSDFSAQLSGSFETIKVLVINDGSTIEVPVDFSFRTIQFEILHLRRNLGHQKAIAIGISYLANENNDDVIIVMDGDGEDRAEDILAMNNEHRKNPKQIIFAKRQKRMRGLAYGFLYIIYKSIFRIFTGKFISFGNFCLIPGEKLVALAHISEIWNHFSGGIIRSRMPYTTVLINRGKRTFGQSKMNFISLIIHGISSISVYIDVVSVRLLVFFGCLILFSILAIFGVVGVRLYTDLAIPGWASTIGIGLILIILQSFFVLLILSFIILSYRSQMVFIPAIHYRDYILKVERYE
jgi:hypothetical protein